MSNQSVFYYRKNFLNKNDLKLLKEWLSTKLFVSGEIANKKKYLENKYGFKNKVTILILCGNKDMIDGKDIIMIIF